MRGQPKSKRKWSAVVNACPELLGAIRASIVAMVRTSQLTRDACGPPPSILFSRCFSYQGAEVILSTKPHTKGHTHSGIKEPWVAAFAPRPMPHDRRGPPSLPRAELVTALPTR
jgi:hypothetical protein